MVRNAVHTRERSAIEYHSNDEPRLIVSVRKLKNNLSYLNACTNSAIVAVVKDNGYGMGLIPYTRCLHALGVRRVAVTSFYEAAQLIQANIDVEIQMLAPLTSPAHIRALADAGVVLMIANPRQCQTLCESLADAHHIVPVQIKLDTGLGRYGFHMNQLPFLRTLPSWIRIHGTYSHFADAYYNKRRTCRQYRRFMHMVQAMRTQGLSTGMLHICASGAFLMYPSMHLDAVRLGSALIGAVPARIHTGLEPIWQVEAPIVAVHQNGSRERIGYGRGLRVRRGARLGVLPVGFTDGLEAPYKRRWVQRCRALFIQKRSNGLIMERNLRPVGKLGANHLLVDLTGSPLAQGDWVKLRINPLRLNKAMVRQYEEVDV